MGKISKILNKAEKPLLLATILSTAMSVYSNFCSYPRNLVKEENAISNQETRRYSGAETTGIEQAIADVDRSRIQESKNPYNPVWIPVALGLGCAAIGIPAVRRMSEIENKLYEKDK